MSDLLLKNIAFLGGVDTEGKSIRKGAEMKDFTVIENAFLLVSKGKIIDFGKMENAPERATRVVDASGKTVLPGWCDSHTHIVFAGSREKEFVDKIKGLSYEEIAKRGGGILNSAKLMETASEESLLESAFLRLGEIKDMGTTSVEIKSGYGLSLESELKMLRVIKKLKSISPVQIKSTFLGAHAFPMEFREKKDAYVDLIIDKMLPQIADEGLADYCDVFCDRGFFSVEQTDRILQAAAKYNMPPKIHANELDFSGGIQVGVKNNALSVDHLECVGEEEIAVLKNSKTMATLLPSTAFYLGMEYAPARKMIDSGLPVAIASDYNPGSSPSGNMPFVVSLSCIKMKMLPEEALNAATINGAYAMGFEKNAGSITKGKRADFFITKKIPSVDFIPYAFGSSLIESVFIEGQLQ
ncbi:MAG: imidazolonepropionase [Chitinophagaceae bacterium]|nr:MAG: imidazolonepropionase [Chitinophagaceae bacterium]